MCKNNKKGFTLVELLAVIVILAIILVIAVPKVMSVIEDAKKATLESTAKMIASAAEKAKVQNTVLGKTEEITCDSVAKINNLDYEDCDIEFEENIAKVTIKGKGKFASLYVCGATKSSATAVDASCILVSLIVNLDNGIDNIEYNEKYYSGNEIILESPTKEGYIFNGWEVTGEGASVNANKLIIGTTDTTVIAKWQVVENAVVKITNLLANEPTLNNGLIEDSTSDKNIRYVGSNPNNYVFFNCEDTDSAGISYGKYNYDYASSCEVWRIIGVFDVDNGSGKIEKRVKLINTESAFTASWDSSASVVNNGRGINQWGESTYEDGRVYEGADLMRLLNGYYIGKQGSECKYNNRSGQSEFENTCDIDGNKLKDMNMKLLTNIAKNMVGISVWYLSSKEWDSGVMSSESYYINERDNSAIKKCKSDDVCTDVVKRTTTWSGFIGLIYPSDFGYASADESCASDIYIADSTCENDNWLSLNKKYWTITPFAWEQSLSHVFEVISNGNVNNNPVSNYKYILPSLYLSSNVKIIGGDGNTTPYKLSL